jgi:hypothetical protein
VYSVDLDHSNQTWQVLRRENSIIRRKPDAQAFRLRPSLSLIICNLESAMLKTSSAINTKMWDEALKALEEMWNT